MQGEMELKMGMLEQALVSLSRAVKIYSDGGSGEEGFLGDDSDYSEQVL